MHWDKGYNGKNVLPAEIVFQAQCIGIRATTASSFAEAAESVSSPMHWDKGYNSTSAGPGVLVVSSPMHWDKGYNLVAVG